MSVNLLRPFKVLGIQQIAIGGLDKHRLRQLWVDKLGLALTGHFVSCLLYTSPSPRDRTRSRMPSSA